MKNKIFRRSTVTNSLNKYLGMCLEALPAELSLKLLVVASFTAGLFFHFFRLGSSEFFGEDEAQVAVKLANAMHGFFDFRSFGYLLSSSHPPMRMVLPMPFVYFFGASEFWVRFPHAVAGFLVLPVLYLLGKRLASKRVAAVTVFIYAVSGISAAQRSANGIGMFILFILLAFYFFMNAYDKPVSAKKNLMITAFWLGLATLTFVEAIVFVPPLIYIFLKQTELKKADALAAAVIYSLFVIFYAIGWFLLPMLVVKLHLIKDIPGNSGHFFSRFKTLGTFNVKDTVLFYLGHNSFLMLLLMLVAIPVGIAKSNKKISMLMIYSSLHIIFWLFIIKVMAGHLIYDMPVVSLVSANGIVYLYDRYFSKHLIRFAFIITLTTVLAFTAWQTFAVFYQDKLVVKPNNLIPGYPQVGKVAFGVPKYKHLGQPAAGAFVRSRSAPGTRVVSNFGEGFAIYYAGSRDTRFRLPDIINKLNNREKMEKLSVRFLVLRTDILKKDGSNKYGTLKKLKPAAVVTVDEKPTLKIYDLQRKTINTIILASEKYDKEFYRRYALWDKLKPNKFK